MSVVDASIWVGLLVPYDAFNVPSSEWLAARLADGAHLAAPRFVLAEVAGAIRRRLRDQLAADAAVATMLSIRGLRLVAMDEPLVQNTAELVARLALRGADAIYAATADFLGEPLITWDQEMITRCTGFIDVRTP